MKKILLSGASGFIGHVCLEYLTTLNFKIDTLGITQNDSIYCNLADSVPEISKDYDWVIHLAGKAHFYPKSEKESNEFYQINLGGTINLIKGLEKSQKLPEAIIFISTVAVYGLDSGEDINEDYPLSGKTPYADSKIQAEKYLQEWCLKNQIRLGILRPPLVAGKNPPGNLRVMINMIKKGMYFSIGKSGARKSLVMVDDIAKIIPALAERGGIYNICDNYHPLFSELEELIFRQLKRKPPLVLPYRMVHFISKLGDLFGENAPINSLKFHKITSTLTFSNKKIIEEFNWSPMSVMENFFIE